jgi:hypothetical protein
MYLFLSAALGLGIYSASNRSKYRKQFKKEFLVSGARLVGEADKHTDI